MTVHQAPAKAVVRVGAVKPAIADCDLHPAPRTIEDLHPFLASHWQEHLATYGGVMRVGVQSGVGYPKGQPLAARRDAFPEGGGMPGSDLKLMRQQHLDANNVVFGVLFPLYIGQGIQHPGLAAALCRAMNEWQVAAWTSQDRRLKGSILVPYHDIAASVAEIEHWAGNDNFVQVAMLSRTPEPLGNRFYWPIYEAAVRAGLPVGVHAFGISGWPTAGGGWPSYYIEDMISHSQSMQSVVASMALEGAFETFPDLKLVLVEGGLAWLPSTTWRLDSLWSRLRSEVPHVKRPPSEYIRRQVWLTSQPIEEPANRKHIVDVLEWIGWDRALFASDYPHWDFDDPAQFLPVAMSAEQKQSLFLRNATTLYGFAHG